MINDKFEIFGKVLKAEEDARYGLKWETIKRNRDRAPEKPCPGPSQLYLFKLKINTTLLRSYPLPLRKVQIESISTCVWIFYPSVKVEKTVRAEIVSEYSKEIKVKITNEKNEQWLVDVHLE